MKNSLSIYPVFLIVVSLMMQAFVFVQPAYAYPEEGATNFNVNNIEGNRFRVSWSSGDGDRRLVLASTDQTFGGSGVPSDGTDYNASSTFGEGDQIGSGNYVVYKGGGSNVTVTGLDSATTYYFRIYEFNGADFQTLYNIEDVLEGSGTTLSAPLEGPYDLEYLEITGNSAHLSWSRGDGSRNIAILRQGDIPGEPTLYQNYFGNATFGNGSAVGGGRAVLVGINSEVDISNLQPNTWYYTRILEYNGNNYPVYSYSTALVDSFLTATAPTQGSTDYSISNVQGDRFRINYSRGDGSRRLIVMRQDEPVQWVPVNGQDYNANSSFGEGDNLGDNTFVVGRTTSANLTVNNLTPSTTYYFAVFEFNGVDSNTWYLVDEQEVLTGQGQTLSAPTVQGGSFVFDDITGNSATVGFDAGNGDGRIVLARAGAPVDDIPVNLQNYFSNSNYNNAPTLGESKIMYRGNGIEFNMTGLQPEVEYHLAVFEYNGSNGPVYNQNNPGIGSFTTMGAPTIPTSNLSYSNIQGDRIRLNYTRGDGAGRIVIARQGQPVNAFPETGQSYSASTTFGQGHELGDGNFVIANTTSANVTITSLSPETLYHFAIIEYNGSGDNRFYMPPDSALTGSQHTLFPPDVQASELAFSDITPNSATISWSSGSGDGRIVLIRPDEPVEDMPQNLSTYFSNSNYNNASSLGSGKVVYFGSGSSVNVTHIPPGEYHVAIIEYNGSNGPVYRTLDPLVGQVTIGGPPEVPATNVGFANIQGDRFRTQWVRGDGTRRLVIMKEGSPVDAWPVDGNQYNANSTFGNGQQLGDGNFVVYSGTGTNTTTTGLQPQTTYYVAIVEYNGEGESSFYQDPQIVAVDSNSTLHPPSVPTSSFFANNVTGNRMQLTWTNGDGDSRMVIGRLGQPVSQIPDDLNSPFAHSTFGNGTHLGEGNYVLYSGSGDNFTVTNLEPDTTYHFAFVEYNGSSGRVYLRDTIVQAAFQTEERPFVAASGLSVSNRNGDRLRLNFSQGNGARRLVVMKKEAYVDVLPQDLQTYNTGSFQEGTHLGDGNYVVALVSGNNANITGLEPDTEYGVAVFEFDGSNGNERYMTNEFLAGFARTAWPPDTPPVGLMVNNVGTTAASLSWTNGTGERRMVIMRPYQPVTFEPEDLNNHGSSNTNFNNNWNFLDDDHRHVYRGNNNNISLSNMEPGTTYHIAIYEYNGVNQPVYGQVPLTGFLTTLPEEGIAIGGFDAIKFCPGQTFAVPYFFAGNLEDDNQISVKLSDMEGSFEDPVLLGTQATTNAQGFVSASLPLSLPQGSGYRLRVLASDPHEISPDNGADLTIADPPVPVIAIEGEETQSCGEPIMLAVDAGGYLVQWYLDGEPLPFGTATTWLAQSSGNYQVAVSGASQGCETFSDALSLVISQAPDFDLPLEEQYCMDDAPVSLEATVPSGGNYAGPGIVDGMFDPALAGVGQHIVTYTFTDEQTDCVFDTFVTVLVADLPQVSVSLPFDTINQLDEPVMLQTGEPEGGEYYLSFDAQVISQIQPAQLDPGEYWLVYRFDNESCVAKDSVAFYVSPAPQMVFAPELDAICENHGLLVLPEGTPGGGYWSGEFVQDNTFDVEQAGTGDFWLVYTADIHNGFLQSDSVEITVNPVAVTEMSVTLCQGAIFELGEETFTESGTFTVWVGFTENGCDSVVQLELNIGHPDLVITQDITLYLDQEGQALLDPDQVYNDALDHWVIESMAIDMNTFGCENLGENEVELVISDVHGNQACGMALVTVADTLAPTVLTQNIVVELDENGVAHLDPLDVDNGSFDNCAVADYELDVTVMGCEHVGENEVTLTVTDISGNSASAVAVVTVQDMIAPTVITQNITVALDQDGMAIIEAADIDNGSFDNCGLDSFAVDIDTFGCEDVGENQVVLTVTDVNGNDASATALVTVIDSLPPVVVTRNISIELDENGQASVDPLDVDDGSWDNCQIENYELDQDYFTTEHLGENLVTLTVTDVHGNAASAQATVYVSAFVPDTFMLTLVSSPEDAGTLHGEGSYEAGEEITLSAVAAEGFVFLYWAMTQDQQVSTEPEFVFTMPDHDVVLTAYFDQETSVDRPEGLTNEMMLFPNPATAHVQVQSSHTIQSVHVTDLHGRSVYVNFNVFDSEYQLKVDGFVPGIYLVRLQHENHISTGKIQVSR